VGRTAPAAALLLLLSLTSAGLAHAESTVLPELLLVVQLNGIDTAGAALVLKAADGGLLVRGADLARWRLPKSESAGRPQRGELFYPLEPNAGLAWRLDEARQMLLIDAAPALFATTRLDLEAAGPDPSPAVPGGFLNYDFSSTRAGSQTQAGALLEIGAFNRFGTGTGSLAMRDGLAAGPRLLRLENTWTHDFPGEKSSLRLGDTVSGAGQWGRPVRLGGVQWASNFATQPGFISFPLPTMSGEAALPSTVDLYVNNALQLRREIPAGPFSLQQLPVVSGQGEARLVVRDLLGREQVIVAPYYATPRLLKAGLHQFSYEAGRVRENFGLASNRYGLAAALATHRLGLSDRLTVEGRGEWMPSRQAAGLGAVMAWPALGTASVAMAASRSERTVGESSGGNGGLLSLGVEHLAAGFGLGVNGQVASSRFAQVGQPADRPAARRNLQSYLAIATGRGSISLAYVQQAPRDAAAVRLVSLGYSVSLGAAGFINLSLVRTAGRQGGVAFAFNFTRALDPRTTASTGANWHEGQGQPQGQVQLQRNPPAGDGGSYGLNGVTGADQRVTAGASLQHSSGTVGLDVDLSKQQTAVRAGASGGIAWIDGGLYASRRIDSSFAVVQLPGLAGVGVYADNQLVARTDADGRALVPRLRPWQANPLRIEQADLPMDAQVEALEMDAVPGWRNGLVLRFPVRRSRNATLAVTTAGGRPMPAGAFALVNGGAREYPFGADGRLYLYELEAANQVEVRWREGDESRQCGFALALPPGDDPMPDLGRQPCAGAAP
jgi:outer membrane usher protein